MTAENERKNQFEPSCGSGECEVILPNLLKNRDTI
jgi:hypothetical protein